MKRLSILAAFALLLSLGNYSHASEATVRKVVRVDKNLLSDIEDTTNSFERRFAIFKENANPESILIACNYFGRLVATADQMKKLQDKLYKIVENDIYNKEQRRPETIIWANLGVGGIIQQRAELGVCLWKDLKGASDKNIQDSFDFELTYTFKDIDSEIATIKENINKLKGQNASEAR